MMANEKRRLIDANALLDKIRNSTASEATKVTAFVFADTAPTVDAVEVVRCKDCKHMGETKFVLHWCHAWGNRVKEDGFCNYGERKDK